jgi:phosphatidylglycerol---prolipoprotein diacylglyceryl transferase
MTAAFITWNPDPIAFHLLSFPVRWYSICWALALLLGFYNMGRLYRSQKIPEEVFNPLFMYCFFGVFIGARLGHCLFYEPLYYLNHITEMLLPIHKFPTGWRITGYEGLSSHGGVIGMFFSLWLYSRKMGMSYLHILDNMGIIAPLSAACIRFGNVMNSEIVGVPTSMPWGVIFAANGEDFARHPAQFYESMFYVLVFVAAVCLYSREKYRKKVGEGFFFGFCVFTIFTFRFFIEFIKEDQVESEAAFLLNIGQMLSIPLALVGLYCMLGGKYCKRYAERFGTEKFSSKRK